MAAIEQVFTEQELYTVYLCMKRTLLLHARFIGEGVRCLDNLIFLQPLLIETGMYVCTFGCISVEVCVSVIVLCYSKLYFN